MTSFNRSSLAAGLAFAGLTLLASVSVQAQPMGGMGMADTPMAQHHMGDAQQGHEHMHKHWQARLKTLHTKLQLSATQESAWTTFTEAMKPPTKPLMDPMDPAALAKLSTPERIDAMNAWQDKHHAAMQAHMKQRGDAARAFYSQLTAEQQKVFDAETLPLMKQGRRNTP